MRTLNKITADLGKAHKQNSKSKKNLEKYRQEFFDAVTFNLERKWRATKVIEIPSEALSLPSKDLENWIRVNHPGWQLQSLRSELNGFSGLYEMVIEEDPALQNFVFLNSDDDMVYQRHAIQEAPVLDDEALKKDRPDVYARITKPVEPTPRELIPLDLINPDDLAIMEEYLVPGKIKLRLESPRKVKSEELVDESE